MSDKFDILKQFLSGGATSEVCIFNVPGTSDDLIIIGGTREQTFNLPFSAKLIHKLLIAYVQNDRLILKKDLSDCKIADFDDTLIYYTLTEEETFNFVEGDSYVQLKVLLEDGSILVSSKLYNKVVDTIDSKYFVRDDKEICALQANVNNQEIIVNKYFDISAGSEQVYNCKFTFDSSWEQLDKKAYFKDEYNHIIKDVEIKNNICEIPAEVIAQPGLIYIGVLGTKTNLQKPTEWSNSVRVSKSCTYVEYSSSGSSGGGTSGDVPYADENTPGIMKLYQGAGTNSDGSISQGAVTRGFNSLNLTAVQFDSEGIEIVVNTDFE